MGKTRRHSSSTTPNLKRKIRIFKMSKEVSGSGTNNLGNNYTSYTDGGYSYTNYNSSGGDGGKSSTYYNTGSGHSFYKGTNGVSFHENSNQGFRDYSYSNTSGSGSGGKVQGGASGSSKK